MKIETDRLESIVQALDNILGESKGEFRNRWDDGSLESPLMRIYKYYQSLTEVWRGETTLVLDPYALESEIKDNFLSADDQQKSNYVKLLNHKLSLIKTEEEEVRESLAHLKDDIKNKIIDSNQLIDFEQNKVSTFVYVVEDTLQMAHRVARVINENIEVFNPTSKEPETLHNKQQQKITILGTKDKPQYLDTVFHIFNVLSHCLLHNETFNSTIDKTISDVIRESYDINYFNSCITLNFQLQDELKTRFLDSNESKIQDRFGNMILSQLVSDAIPTYNKIYLEYQKMPPVKGSPFGENQNKESQDKYFMMYVLMRLSEWIDTMCFNLELFTPELYKRNRVAIESFEPILGLTARTRMPRTDEEPTQTQPTEPGVKLTWTCKPAVAGYIISELIRAGYLAPPITGGEMSLSKLAGICNQLFEFKDHTPTVASWRNVVDRDRNTLPDMKRVKLKLPDSDQLS